MSFSQGLKIGLILIILGFASIHASRQLTLCGGVLQTLDSPPTTQSLASPTTEIRARASPASGSAVMPLPASPTSQLSD